MKTSLINIRERLLQRLFQIPSDEVLNPFPSSEPGGNAVDVSTLLRKCANQMKAEAIDTATGLVDYDRLRHTIGFSQYTNELIPRLHHLDLENLGEGNNAASFWINLYNTLTLHAVIEYGITESIASKGLGGQVRFFRQAAYHINGMRFSLEDIEHGVLRGNAGNPFQFSQQFSPKDARLACVIIPVDPRIHFALNCASISCPPINFYTPDELDTQLDLASAGFVAAETKLSGNRFMIASIFKWYQRDFGSKSQIADFLLQFLPEGKRKDWLLVNRASPKFGYIPYDWGLNKLK